MKTTTNPFKKYTTMNNTLISKLGCADVYRAYVLSLTTDKETNTTDTTLEQLAGFIKESENNYHSSKSNFTDSLRDTEVVNVVSKRDISFKNGNSVTRNSYTFIKGTEFRMVGVEFYALDLEIKLKGYLLKLFSLANVNTMLLDKSANEIYKLTGVSRATQKKYNEALASKGLIKETENGIILNVTGFNNIKKDKTVKPTAKTLEIINMHKDILKSHIEAYNRKGNKITKLTNEAIEKLKMDGLSAATCKIATYFVNGFGNVKDINKLINSIQFPKVKKEEVKEEWATFTI